MKLSMVFVGFGNVGKAFAKVLMSRKEKISSNYNVDVHVKAILTSKGGILAENSIPWNIVSKLIDLDRVNRHERFKEGIGLDNVLESVSVNVAVFAIPPSYANGEPNRSMFWKLLENGVHIITADKTVLAHWFHETMSHAKKYGSFVGYRATVMAGTPAIDVIRGLKGRDIKKLKSVLNATTNYILSLMEKGISFENALREVIRIGLAEPDPSIDIDGFDSAAKLTILLCTLGLKATINNIRRISLKTIDSKTVRAALEKGGRIKYIAGADLEADVFYVKPEEISEESVLAKVTKNYNALEIEVDEEVVSLTGPAGPPPITAKSMFTDLIELIEKYVNE